MPLCRSSSPGCQTCERAHVPRTPPNTTLQTCRGSHRSWWPLEPGSHNLPTVVGPSKSPNHPSRLQASFTNALIHRWSAQITHAAMTAYAASLLEFDCVASTVTDGNQPFTSEVLAEATLPPHRQPRPSPPLRSSGLDLALFPCTSGAAGI